MIARPLIPDPGKLVPVAALVDIAAQLLRHARMRADDAQAMARLLVYAQESGINSHGLAHLPAYLTGIASGALNPRPQFQLRDTRPGAAVLEADRAPGVLAGLKASDETMRRAASTGVSVVAVRNSSHFGASSAFINRMVERDMIGLVFSNASPTVAPRGARTALLGTNPIAAGFPRKNGPPVIIDMATTAGSRGRIRHAAAEGTPIPDHWALDGDGQPTTDATAALGGTMQAIGGAKGTGLTLMVEMLCVALSSGVMGRDVLPPQTDGDDPRGVSHVFIAIDTEAFGGADLIGGRIDDIARSIEQATPVTKSSPPRLPGARAAQSRAAAETQGILISDAVHRTLTRAQDISAQWRTNRDLPT